MITSIEINDEIYVKLASIAKERGVEVTELIRWIIGDYVNYVKFSTSRAQSVAPTLPLPMERYQQTINRISKLTEMMLKSFFGQGGMKCPNCTMPLTMEAMEQNKCQNCGAEI